MVSLRCKMLVQAEIENLGFELVSVDLGMIEINQDITREQREILQKALFSSGLSLLEDKKAILAERIKNLIIKVVHNSDEQVKYKFSHYLSEELGYDYNYMANLFSSEKGITIEKYFIKHRIERVKELLLYDELSLKEISYRMHYSSVAHLSAQFKKVTGITPTYFKRLANYRTRIPLEDL
jgi:AraC-like DNA-binding protein